jgi:hypothetical protein
MVDRVRLDRRTVDYHAMRALQPQNDINYDVLDRIAAGWRLRGTYYTPGGMVRGPRGEGNHIVTRLDGYTPCQSVVQPDGRYAYGPNQD